MVKRDTGRSSWLSRQQGSGLSTSAIALLIRASSSVWPSGGDFAASRAAISPAPPGRFSTITGWPKASESLVEICRARMSGELPAGLGTRMRMGLDGNPCARPGAASAHCKMMNTVNFLSMERAPSSSNFIRQVIEADLASGKHKAIVTRFPPEPNGYLHFGHAKSIVLNFSLPQAYGGRCNLRFDDTNPEKEEQEYVDSIIDAVRWLGSDYGPKPLYASDYFGFMYQAAEHLIERGFAYVDSQSADEIRANRGTLTEPGRNSPYRDRAPAENLRLFRSMKQGEFPDGAHVLRAKIDMASPNINLRDPVLYRIKHAEHHRTGDAWPIYPMYTYAHPIEDAVERVTHSLCTLEFEDQRPFYDWLLERVPPGGPLPRARPPRRGRPARAAAAAADRVRAPQPHQRGAVEAQAHPARRGAPRLGLGRPAHADARRRPAPRLHRRGVPPLRREDRRLEGEPADRFRRARGVDARAPERNRAAAHGGPRPAEAGDRQLPGRSGGARVGAEPPAEARLGPARGAVLARALDRARRLRAPAAQGLLPALSRQRGPAALRLRRQMHRYRHRRGPLHVPPRFEVRHARGRAVQGEGQYSLGERAPRPRLDGASIRSPLPGAQPGRRALLHRGSQPGFDENHHRAT